MLRKIRAHLDSAEMTYWEHLRHVWAMNWILVKVIYWGAVHSVLPHVYETTAPDKVREIADKIRSNL